MSIHEDPNEANQTSTINANGGMETSHNTNINKVLYEKTSNVYGLGLANIVFFIEDKKYLIVLFKTYLFKMLIY